MTKFIDINELPRFSPWPARLLGLSPWEDKKKSKTEISREYEGEKWGPLLHQMEKSGEPFTLANALSHRVRDTAPLAAAENGKIFATSAAEANMRRRESLRAILSRDYDGAPIVELGAGFGNPLLWLAKQPEFKDAKFYAGEYAASGVELLRRIADEEKIDLVCGRCDLTAQKILDFEIPKGSLIFTSHTAVYVRDETESFLRQLLKLKPARVVHCEPLYEHCDDSTLWGQLRKRYIEANGYNRNLLTEIRRLEREGLLRVVEEMREHFATNALSVPSVIIWEAIK